MDKIVQSSNNLWYDALDEKATSQGVESSLLQLQRDRERLSKIASNDEFDDDVRQRAKDYEEYLAGITSYGDAICAVYGISTATQDY